MSRDQTRTRERTGSPSTDRDVDGATDFDIGLDEAVGDPAGASDRSTDGLRGRLATRANALFSPRWFVAALALSAVGLVVTNAFVPLPGSGLLGVFLAAFCFGAVVDERRYAEAAAAGGLAVGVSVLFGFAVVALLGGVGVPLGALGAAVGAATGTAGTYFGRDLRRGLTRDVP
jgi:hypothetical protein